jgi:branched-chain amino acid transport system substrate-binding protein
MRAPALILLFLLILTGSAARAAEPLVIGEINPLTGTLALQGTSIHQGIALAIEEQNAGGGVDGRSIALLSRDRRAGRSGPSRPPRS